MSFMDDRRKRLKKEKIREGALAIAKKRQPVTILNLTEEEQMAKALESSSPLAGIFLALGWKKKNNSK